MKRILKNLDWGDISLGIIALIALVLGVLDFTPLVQLTNGPALQMVLSGIGLVLGAVIIQSARRKAEISELRQAIGQAEVVLTIVASFVEICVLAWTVSIGKKTMSLILV